MANPNSMKAGDTSPLVVTLGDLNGPVNLTGSTVRIHVAPSTPGVGHEAFEGLCTVLQTVDLVTGRISNRGEVKYQWQLGETALPGVYDVEWRVTFADGSTRTFPNDRSVSLEIEPSLAPTTPVFEWSYDGDGTVTVRYWNYSFEDIGATLSADDSFSQFASKDIHVGDSGSMTLSGIGFPFAWSYDGVATASLAYKNMPDIMSAATPPPGFAVQSAAWMLQAYAMDGVTPLSAAVLFQAAQGSAGAKTVPLSLGAETTFFLALFAQFVYVQAGHPDQTLDNQVTSGPVMTRGKPSHQQFRVSLVGSDERSAQGFLVGVPS